MDTGAFKNCGMAWIGTVKHPMNGKEMKMKKKIALFFLMMVCFLGFSVAHATTLSFYTGTDVLMNSGGGPDTGQPWLFAGQNLNISMPLGLKYDSLLKFDDLFGPNPGQIPPGSAIASASLHLYLYYDVAGYERRVYQMTEDWNESTRWNTLPGGGGIVPGINTKDSTVAAWIGGASSLWKELDVTTSLQAWSDGENQFGWGIWGEKAGTFSPTYINSFNNDTNRPWLQVDYRVQSVPEPGVMLLLLFGIGGVALAGRKTH
jgi:hypothetical protein